jgi:hypothetical protein
MRVLYLLIFITISQILSAQSKKEQIIDYQRKLDSLQNILSNAQKSNAAVIKDLNDIHYKYTQTNNRFMDSIQHRTTLITDIKNQTAENRDSISQIQDKIQTLKIERKALSRNLTFQFFNLPSETLDETESFVLMEKSELNNLLKIPIRSSTKQSIIAKESFSLGDKFFTLQALCYNTGSSVTEQAAALALFEKINDQWLLIDLKTIPEIKLQFKGVCQLGNQALSFVFSSQKNESGTETQTITFAGVLNDEIHFFLIDKSAELSYSSTSKINMYSEYQVIPMPDNTFKLFKSTFEDYILVSRQEIPIN